ncbi:MAG: Ycf66 family protein, partial [Chamaesiphon sp.]|nr:Ycf66 family protein [Chamaesiphon sp.]
MGFGISAASLFGLVLVIASLSLFVTSKLKPSLYEDSDNIYVIAGVLCGLILMVNIDLNPAMSFQQLLLLPATITLMWRFVNLRAENKQLKSGDRITSREVPPRKSAYSARIDDEPEYVPAKRGNRRTKDRFGRTNEREDREELPSRRSATRELPEDRFAETAPRRSFTEPARTEVSSLTRRQNDSWDSDDDWNDQAPVQVRRALPDADLVNRQPERRSARRRPERPDLDDPGRNMDSNDDPGSAPRRRRPRPENPGDGSQQMASAAPTRQRRESSSQEGTTAN